VATIVEIVVGAALAGAAVPGTGVATAVVAMAAALGLSIGCGSRAVGDIGPAAKAVAGNAIAAPKTKSRICLELGMAFLVM
jgi:hypothetical protein